MAFENELTFKLTQSDIPPIYDVYASGMGQIGTICVYNDNSLCTYTPCGKALELDWSVSTMKGMLCLMELLESGWQGEISQWYGFSADGEPEPVAAPTLS